MVCVAGIPASPGTIASWGHSSVGRAVALQASGRRFDPVCLHHLPYQNGCCEYRKRFRFDQIRNFDRLESRFDLLIDIVNEEFCLHCAPGACGPCRFTCEVLDAGKTSTFFDTTLPFYNRGRMCLKIETLSHSRSNAVMTVSRSFQMTIYQNSFLLLPSGE